MTRVSIFLSWLQRIQHWGEFDKDLFTYAFRTAIASGFALVCGWLLGLEHPQWAAMSVWAASQPGKGMLLEKCLFRLVGTLIGTIVGVIIIYTSQGDILYIALGLTIWITLCTGAGNLINGLFSYLTLLSGYTASLVALLDITQGSNIYALGLDRMLTVSLGVVTAMAVGLMFIKASNEEVMSVRIKQLTHAVFTLLTQAVHSSIPSDNIASLVKEAAMIDGLLEPHSAGSLRSRRSVRSIRAIIYSNVSLLTRLNSSAVMTQLTLIESSLQQLTYVIENDLGIAAELKCIDSICNTLGNDDLGLIFNDLQTALIERLRYKKQGKIERTKLHHMLVLHRDWVAAKQAMLRTFIVLGTIGLLWNWNPSPIGAFVMLGTSVMVTLFSTFEAPASMMGRMFLWQIVGLSASLLLKGYFWVGASNEAECVFWMALLILPVIIPLSSPRFFLGSMDYVMMFLLLSNIQYPANFQLSVDLPIGLAAVGGTLVAYIAFLLIFPTNGAKRSSRIEAAILHDLQRIYTVDWNDQKMAFIHSRAQHRLLKLIQTKSQLSTDQLMVAVNIVSMIQLIGRTRKMLAMDSFAAAQKETAIALLAQLVEPMLSGKYCDTRFEKLFNHKSHLSDDLIYLLAGVNT
ncbi:FUSC family protein [Shewanella sp. A14]